MSRPPPRSTRTAPLFPYTTPFRRVLFRSIDYPGADFTDVRGINNAGEIVGYAQNASGNFGFKYSGGHFSRLPPAPGGRTINGHGINDSGLIVGSADSADGTTTEGFILDGSTYAFFSYP